MYVVFKGGGGSVAQENLITVLLRKVLQPTAFR